MIEPFFVKLTSTATTSTKVFYTWTEQTFDTLTGQFTEAPSARTGTAAAGPFMQEVNNLSVSVPCFALAFQEGVAGGLPFYRFSASGGPGGPGATIVTLNKITTVTGTTNPKFRFLQKHGMTSSVVGQSLVITGATPINGSFTITSVSDSGDQFTPGNNEITVSGTVSAGSPTGAKASFMASSHMYLAYTQEFDVLGQLFFTFKDPCLYRTANDETPSLDVNYGGAAPVGVNSQSGLTIYSSTLASTTSGFTGTQTVVTSVSFTDCILSVVTKQFAFTNGLLTSIT